VARLRLADLTTNEIADAVDKTLAAVDLSQHARKLVRFLSGGQRKRVNIAMELLARPRLLFLDEPTSGLDPGLDLEVMTLLRGWARGESVTPASQPGDPKTIVLVTHATENIELCDYIAFMERGGRLAYFGPPHEAKRFFFPEREPEQVTFAEIYLRVAIGPAPVAAAADSWAEVYQQSAYFERYVTGRCSQATSTALALPAVTPVERRLLPTRPQVFAGFRQFGILAGRYARLIGRDRMNAVFLLLQAPLVALLLAAVSTPQALRPAGALDAEKVLFILACAAVWLGIVNSTKVIVAEQDIYQRERLYGLGAVPYVFSKIAVLGIIGLIQMALLVFFIGLVVLLPDRGLIAPIQMEYFITLALTVIAGQALGLLISALAGTTDLANTLMFLLLIVQVIFSGLLFDPSGLAEIPAALTISRWSLQALGSSTDLNRLLLGVMPGYDWNAAYGADIFHLLGCWAALLLYAAGCVGLACWRQGRK
jgi:energy-coupling factor transporter ATP-binding protein EcfA2